MSKYLTALKSILAGGTVSFHSIFAKALGSVNAGLMLSQGYFWQENAKFGKPITIDGKPFFAKTIEEWYEETGISEESQKTARQKLRACGILHERLAGSPAKMHYHFDLEALVAVIHRYSEKGISVAVNHGNKQREKPRTSSGKFRQQVAVNHGNSLYIESFETFESKGEGAVPAVVVSLHEIIPLKSLEPIDEAFIPSEPELQKKEPSPAAKKSKAAKEKTPKPEGHQNRDVAAFLELKEQNFFTEILANGTWQDYKDHRREIKKGWYVSAKSESLAVKELFTISAGSCVTAQLIVNQSRTGGWAGLFPLKQKNIANGSQQKFEPAHVAQKRALANYVNATRTNFDSGPLD